MSSELRCPHCGMEDYDWSWRDQKYGCYGCGKMFTKTEGKRLK